MSTDISDDEKDFLDEGKIEILKSFEGGNIDSVDNPEERKHALKIAASKYIYTKKIPLDENVHLKNYELFRSLNSKKIN